MRTPSCNQVSTCSLLNTIFHIEINKNVWENFFSFSGSNLGLLGKSFPLFIVSDFTNFYLKIHNLLWNLLVSDIIPPILKLGMENA